MINCVPIDGDYEVVRAGCPFCGHRNVFSRVSDLRTLQPISYLEVVCQETNCGRVFCINSDDIGPAYRLFFYESYEFIKSKRYSFAVVSSVQSLELFFAHAVRERWLWQVYKVRGGSHELNSALQLLFERTRAFSYQGMRNLFLRAAITAPPHSLAEGRNLVESIEQYEPTPSDNVMKNTPEPLARLLLDLKSLKAHELRNDILHKQAYRPTREEAETTVESIRNVLLPLASVLRVEYESV